MGSGHCSLQNILTLGLKDVNKKDNTELFELILPFFNEFANLANISFFLPIMKYDIYPHHDTKFKLLIDVVALSGICLNVARKVKSTDNWKKGFVKGVLYLIFAFALPNLYMDKILFFFSTNKYIKLAIGIIVIYILEIVITSLVCIFDDMIDSNNIQI